MSERDRSSLRRSSRPTRFQTRSERARRLAERSRSADPLALRLERARALPGERNIGATIATPQPANRRKKMPSSHWAIDASDLTCQVMASVVEIAENRPAEEAERA